jgi:hypothetical protein
MSLLAHKHFEVKYIFIFLIYDYTRMTWVRLLKHKFEAFEKFKIFKELVENEMDLKLRCLRLERGEQFTFDEFNSYYENPRIKRQFDIARTPE